MSGLIGGLNMQVYKIIGLKGIYGSLCLTLIISVKQTGRTLHVNYLHAGVVANSLNKVHGRYYRAALN